MGLLDTFLGTPDQTRALGLLGAQMMSGNTGQGFLSANEYLSDAPKRRMQSQLMEAQLQETLAQADERKLKREQADRQAKLMESFFPGMAGGGAPGGAGAPAGNDILSLAQKFGIPPQAIQADIVFNGGKKISELLAKHGSRDMQVTNGYAYDKNNLGPGFMPFLNTSQSGQTSMGRIGPDGLPVVSAPRGAMETYGAYRGIDEGTKANFDTVTVNPAGQPPQMTTRGALVRNPQVSGVQVPPAQQAAMDSDRTAILQQELTKAQTQLQSALRVGDQSGAARAQADIAALQREMGNRSATVGMPLQSEEDKLRMQRGVEGDAKSNEARVKDVQTAKKFLSIADQADSLLKSGPTSSGFGSMVDKGASFFGATPKGAVAAQQLKAIGGWLVANVPRMEGPQSNFDVDNYKIMAANVANDSLPVDQRAAALNTIKRMMQTTIDGGAAGSWEPGKPAAAGWGIREKK